MEFWFKREQPWKWDFVKQTAAWSEGQMYSGWTQHTITDMEEKKKNKKKTLEQKQHFTQQNLL